MTTDASLFRNLQAVTSKIHDTDNIDEIMLDVSKDICTVFEADRLTLYAANEDRSLIVSKVKTGINHVKELKLPVMPEFSVAGYVALYKKLLNIRDAYDDRELASFDPPCGDPGRAHGLSHPADARCAHPGSPHGGPVRRRANDQSPVESAVPESL